MPGLNRGTQQLIGRIGIIDDYAGSVAPDGAMLCYGQAISRTVYAALFAVIGTTFGAGDGSTTFNIPDLRGYVLAGKDNMGGAAANRLTTAGSGVNGANMGAVGGAETVALTTAQLAAHNHGVTESAHTHTLTDPGHIHTNTLSDPGHSHTYNANYYPLSAQGSGTATPYCGGGQIMGGGMATATTGVTITNASKVTGITMGTATTGLTTNNNGSGNAHQNTQPTIVINKIIWY